MPRPPPRAPSTAASLTAGRLLLLLLLLGQVAAVAVDSYGQRGLGHTLACGFVRHFESGSGLLTDDVADLPASALLQLGQDVGFECQRRHPEEELLHVLPFGKKKKDRGIYFI